MTTPGGMDEFDVVPVVVLEQSDVLRGNIDLPEDAEQPALFPHRVVAQARLELVE